jgi:hypothetical protein
LGGSSHAQNAGGCGSCISDSRVPMEPPSSFHSIVL